MNVHIFNPEHDIALAANMPRFIAPHAARQLRADMGFLPAFWADDADVVLVDDVEAAREAVRHLRRYAHQVTFLSKEQLRHMDVSQVGAVLPWGWDATVCHELLSANAALQPLLPDECRLRQMRDVSNRRFAAAHILPQLVASHPQLVGASAYCTSIDEVLALLPKHTDSVLKAPWSSSGRGLRYVRTLLTQHELGWATRTIERQGGVMVEPRYQKVADFGMEFHSDGTAVSYCGLSLFSTENGAYIGSVLATEADKEQMIERYVPACLLRHVRQWLERQLTALVAPVYTGALGVDMMVVANSGATASSPATAEGFLLHPCVELNLRRTMGHVALRLSPDAYSAQGVMRIFYNGGKYKMRVQSTTDNLLNTSLV